MSLATFAPARTVLLAAGALLAVGLLMAGSAAAAVPPAPDRLQCAHEADGARVLEWPAVDEARYYHVYRGIDNEAPTWLATTPGTRYVDNETSDADQLTYWVTAVSKTGESPPVACDGRRASLTPILAGVGVVGLGALATFFLFMRP